MKRTAAIVAFAILLAPWISFAQAAPNSQLPKNFDPQAQRSFSIMVLPGAGACPAMMHARHQAGLHAQRYVNGDPKPETPAMHLILTLTGGRAPIAHASVLVHGLNGNSHIVQTNTIHTGHPDASRAIDLSFTPAEDNTVSANLVLPGFTSVSSIDVVSATYDDGSTWKPTEGRACQVIPDPFMLVAAQTR